MHAARYDHPGWWTCDDVEAARLEANALTRPWGANRRGLVEIVSDATIESTTKTIAYWEAYFGCVGFVILLGYAFTVAAHHFLGDLGLTIAEVAVPLAFGAFWERLHALATKDCFDVAAGTESYAELFAKILVIRPLVICSTAAKVHL